MQTRMVHREGDPGGAGDLGIRRVQRGEDQRFMENAEYSIVLPDVDKVAIIALAVVEMAAVLTQTPIWSTELHIMTIGAIAGLGGYSMVGRRRINEQARKEAAYERTGGDIRPGDRGG